MAIYVIGDVHGCFKTFLTLLDKIGFDSRRDRLWFVGDLVNKGPRSLEMLRWAHSHQAILQIVLGNHDLHLLRLSLRLRKPKPTDTLAPILEAPDGPELIRWLGRQPLLIRNDSYTLVHAGILPAWTIKEASDMAELAHRGLEERPTRALNKEKLDIPGVGRHITANHALQVLTGVRCCYSPENADFDYTGSPEEAPDGLKPWFSFPNFSKMQTIFLFGHWARMGFRRFRHAVCLDSACVYGGSLTALRLEDQVVFQAVNQDSKMAIS